MSTEAVLEQLKDLTMVEAAELVTKLEDTFGVSRHAVSMQEIEQVLVEPAKPEQDEFDVIINGFLPEKKIELIKVVRKLTNLGLKESKDLVELEQATIGQGLDKEAALNMQKLLTDAGAIVILK